MQLLNRLKNFYLNHYHYFCYYQNLVRKHGIHFGQKNYNQPIIRIKRPFFFVKLSAALSLYYFVVFGGYVKYPCLHEQCPIWILVDIIPDAHKDYFCATIAIWGWMHLLMMIFGLSSKLHRFRFLATLNLDDPNTIKYLNLDEEMLQKINRFYRLVFSWYSKVPVLTADTGCFLATSKETIEKALWERSFILCVANVIICKIWCYHASNTTYASPIFIWHVAYYLQVKYQSVHNGMRKLRKDIKQNYQKMSQSEYLSYYKRFIRLNKQNSLVQAEAIEYGRSFKRFLTISVIGYIQNITYFTYLIFFTDMPMSFKHLYWIIYVFLIFNLGVLIHLVGPLCSMNDKLAAISRDILNVINLYKSYDSRKYIQMTSIYANLSDRKNGFRLINNFRINSTAYYEVIV
ncbi:hypothetical protein QR98_0018350 [Sarcoptes scabiei]|uniref:Gustatory receptor n=1 Tax=Sarcoptes scabiei TaxID=52283 RepID=A0A131ZXH8_SARSC|nr:hypothetical protein QR98_0018350 [Sarcoptes scabiei]